MSKEYFGYIVMFESKKEAEKELKDNAFAETFGYEVFMKGGGE